MPGRFDRLRRGRGETAEEAPTAQLPAAAPEAAAVPAEGETAQVPAVPADVEPGAPPAPGFQDRGRMRRRLRYVRRAREIPLRDLGGLVFDLHRFGRERNDLVEAKLAALTALDGEMRTLETALADRRDITVLREPGLATCPRCGALHASDANFCSSCGLPVGKGAGLPAGPTAAPTPAGTGQTLTVVPGAATPDAEPEQPPPGA